jgi:hypothetical protein
MPAPVKVTSQAIMNALLKWRGNVVAAAGEVGMAPNSMYERIDRMGLDLAAIRSANAAKPVTPFNAGNPVTGIKANERPSAGTQKTAPQAGTVYPRRPGKGTMGTMQATAEDDVPIKTAPRRHQPLRLKPEQRDLIQSAAWQLQARWQRATDENLILEQFIDEGFAVWLEEKLKGRKAKAGER